MRYWCSKCKSELILDNALVNQWVAEDAEYKGDHEWNYKWEGERVLCDICTNHYSDIEYWMERIPDFETPEQYEKRTGKVWNGAVFTHCNNIECDSDCKYRGWGVGEEYGCLDRPTILCAQSPEPPPDGYVPEVEK